MFANNGNTILTESDDFDRTCYIPEIDVVQSPTRDPSPDPNSSSDSETSIEEISPYDLYTRNLTGRNWLVPSNYPRLRPVFTWDQAYPKNRSITSYKEKISMKKRNSRTPTTTPITTGLRIPAQSSERLTATTQLRRQVPVATGIQPRNKVPASIPTQIEVQKVMQLPDQALTAVVPRTRMPTWAELMNPAPSSPDEALARNQHLTKPTAVPNMPNNESPAPKGHPAPKKSRDIGNIEGFKHGGGIAFKVYSYERNPSGLIRPAGTKGRFKRDGYKRFTEPGSGDTCAPHTRKQAPENDEEANSSPSPLTAGFTKSDTTSSPTKTEDSE